jgi:adenosyl cobinamide kinase/adenosyl cobinamide phosphate guanylyltransferase
VQDLTNPCRSLLVLGGARLSKRGYAQRLAEASGRHPVLIAEMAERIARHAATREAQWALVEEPVALAEALRREARGSHSRRLRDALAWQPSPARCGSRRFDTPSRAKHRRA